jgi:lysophospholipase L1-like esterase
MALTQNSSRRKFIRSTALAVFAGSVPLGIVRSNTAEAIQGKAKGMTVLFQGDSITDGNRGRTTNPNHIMGHGYAFSIASRWGADFPSTDLVFYNRGISGNKVSQLQARWKTDCLDLHPDVLSILVGINDAALFIEKPAIVSEEVYRDLLRQVRQQNPLTLLVLGLPFLAPVGKFKQNWDAYNSIVSKLSERIRILTVEFDAVLVDYQMVFTEAVKKAPHTYWLWDGIHPTVAGHELMAREWFKQVSMRLKFLRKYS